MDAATAAMDVLLEGNFLLSLLPLMQNLMLWLDISRTLLWSSSYDRNIMDNYYQELEDTEENKLAYMPIFNEYISLIEKYIDEEQLERILGYNMAAFTTTL